MKQTGLVLCFLVCNLGVHAEDMPIRGMVHNTIEDSSISFSCTQVSSVEIECEFNQTAVRRKAKAADKNQVVEKAKAQFQQGVKIEADDCKTYRSLIDILEGRAKPPKNQDKLTKMAAFERQDLLRGTRAMLTYCQNTTEPNYLAVALWEHDKHTRTCSVSSNRFNSRFRPVPNSNGRTWVQVSSPEGTCGIVQLNRFERVSPDGPLKGMTFWNYIARKAITNPGGSIGALTCSGLDQQQYEYIWNGESEKALGCDYIVFSPI